MPPPDPQAPRRRLIPWYAGALCAGAVTIAALSPTDRLLDAPLLFGLLLAAVLVLDLVKIDLFERGTISPAAAPMLALAFLFGPLGPLVAEAVIATRRLACRTPLIWVAFDFGQLTLAGAAAAGAFALVPATSDVTALVAAALGGLVYYALNGLLLAVGWTLREEIAPLAAWRERFAWAWPHYLTYGLLAGAIVIGHNQIGLTELALIGPVVFLLWITEKQYVARTRSSVAELRERAEALEAANLRLRDLYLSTVTSLARTIEAKDPYTGGHTERVAAFAVTLARRMGFAGDDLAAVEVGGVIHDVGKIGIRDEVLNKPGKLTEEEFAEMRRHPEISSYILERLDLPRIVKQMARNHHERYDGAGYPDGLEGEEIPLAARILAVADALDAMTSDRPYRAALPVDVALAELRDLAGRQFCPSVVEALNAWVQSDPTFALQFGAAPSASRVADADGVEHPSTTLQ